MQSQPMLEQGVMVERTPVSLIVFFAKLSLTKSYNQTVQSRINR